jgi:hypothetical protein
MPFRRSTETLQFKNIADEFSRTYRFPGNETVTIVQPRKLNVSKSGGHRVVDAAGNSHYIPTGWIQLTWQVKPGRPAFAF